MRRTYALTFALLLAAAPGAFAQDPPSLPAPTDPVALVSGAAVIALVSLAACLAPARRAMRVDPMEALRSD